MIIGQKPICEKCTNFLAIQGVSGTKYPRCILNIMPIIVDPNSGAIYIDCAKCPAFVSIENPDNANNDLTTKN